MHPLINFIETRYGEYISPRVEYFLTKKGTSAWLLGKLVPIIGLNSNVVKLIKSGVKGLPN